MIHFMIDCYCELRFARISQTLLLTAFDVPAKVFPAARDRFRLMGNAVWIYGGISQVYKCRGRSVVAPGRIRMATKEE